MEKDTSVIGNVTNQHESMEVGYDTELANSVYNMPWFDLCETEPYFGKITLRRTSKITDFISSVIFTEPPYLVSEKVRDVLGTCKLPPHQFFPVDIYHNDQRYPYFCMHIPRMLETLKHVDYNASHFSLRNVMPQTKLADLTIKSASDLIPILQKKDTFMREYGLEIPPSVCAESYTMTGDFLDSLDIFNLPYIDPATYFSHALREKLEKYNLSGLSCRVPSRFSGFS